MKKFIYIILFFLTLLSISLIVFREKIPTFLDLLLSPVSVATKNISEVVELQSTDGKMNVLVLGIDERSPDKSAIRSVLTDTIMVASVDVNGKGIVLTSIPRDLWVPEKRTKINSVYTLSKNDIDTVKKVVQRVVGIPIHYYVIVGFEAFNDAINAVGGVTVDVENSFHDYEYPIEGKENVIPESARYEHISFEKGLQFMDAETALKFSRSRHSTNPLEVGDFARARRQHQVISALKDSILSSKTLANPQKLISLYNSYSDNVETDFNILHLPSIFYAYSDLENVSIRRIVLSNEAKDDNIPGSGMLKLPSREERDEKYGGLYVLVPHDSTYDNIHSFIWSLLFADDEEEEVEGE